MKITQFCNFDFENFCDPVEASTYSKRSSQTLTHTLTTVQGIKNGSC